MFEVVARPVIENCLKGYNGTVFVYGQTGSGKTYSMSGGETWENRGIIPRTFSLIYRKIEEEKIKMRSRLDAANQLNFKVYVQYFEIYNENGFDLLDRKHAELPFEKWNQISIYEDLNQNV